MFEGGLKVPFLMKWPREISKRSIFTSPVGHVDMFATAVAISGHTLEKSETEKIDGIDLLPFLQEQRCQHDTTNGSSTNYHHPHETLYWRSGHYKAMHYKDEWKLQISEIPKKIWLFDMKTDPTEKINLAESKEHADILNILLSVMQREDSKQADPLWPALSATYIPIDKVGDEPQAIDDEYVLWEN